MSDIIEFLKNHIYFTVAAIALNTVLANLLIVPIAIKLRSNIIAAKAGRGKNNKYTFYVNSLKESIRQYDKKQDKPDMYNRAKLKLKKAGYRSEYAPVTYLILKYPVTLVLAVLTFIASYPNITKALFISVFSILTIELIIWNKKKQNASMLEMSIYKIYKYLHNQISSGIQPAEAVKTVYEVIKDKELQEMLILLSANYSRSNNIDQALEEFKANFDIHEAEAFSVAIKQGIETGDNTGILQRQEAVMFKKYLNHVQAETEACKGRSAIATAFFVGIVVIMISVPMFRDVMDALNQIFIS